VYPTTIMMLALDEHDDTVIDAVLSLSKRLGMKRLIVVHVVQQDAIPAAIRGSLPAPEDHPCPELEQRVDALRAALPQITVTARVEVGSPVAQLDALIAELSPDLLVLGRSLFIGGKTAWGPTAQAMVRHARCSSLIVPRGWKPPAKGAVVGIDFSDDATRALRTARTLFDDVVCIYHYDLRISGSGAITEDEFSAELERNARQHFDQDVRPAVAGGDNLQLELVAGHRPADALLERAGTDRVLVVGSRGLSPLAAMLLGSTADRVAGRANAPVLIDREKDQVMGVIEGLVHR